MKVSVDIEIDKPKETVWSVITDIKNAKNFISGIINLEIINEPVEGLDGLKWKETRLMFGKEASEIMWITESIENRFYRTRAESHGSIYITEMSLTEKGTHTILKMTFFGEAQNFVVKLISTCMGLFIKGSMKKALIKDLEDIKRYIER